MGIMKKCFEILENKPQEEGSSSHHISDSHNATNQVGASGVAGVGLPIDDPEATEDEEGEDDEDEDEDDDGTAIGGPGFGPGGPGDFGMGDDDDDDEGKYDSDEEENYEGEEERGRVKLRLREILFYDDKVAVFKSRHGKL
jgi:hypothetical protein